MIVISGVKKGTGFIMNSHFFAMLSRMKYINRWALMRNTRTENLCEHSYEVSMLAHVLAVIGNSRFGGNADAGLCAMIGMYHDAPEILTGDMPTPVKYNNPAIREAYKQVEETAGRKLLGMLPEEFREEYERLLMPDTGSEEYRIVKAADKLSAMIKCVEELAQGNREFAPARRATERSLRAMKLPAADLFLEEFLPSYALTLDELND